MKHLRTISTTAFATLVLFAVPTLTAFAQVAATTGSGLVNPLNVSSFSALLQEIITYVVGIGSLFLTIMLVYVGFLFVAARGNAEAVGKARSALLWTVIGGLLLLGASALAIVISTTVQGL